MASVWVGLELIATFVAIWFKIWAALSEIVVATVAQLIIGAFVVHGELGALREMPFDPGQLAVQLGRPFLLLCLEQVFLVQSPRSG